MDSNFSKKFGTIVMVFLIAVCFMPAAAGAASPGIGRHDNGFDGKGRDRSPLGIWRNPQMVQQLELTKEQVKQLRDADFTSREKHLALKAQLDRLRLQMNRAFSDDNVDNGSVRQLAKQMSDLQGKMFVQGVESRLTLRKILTADQIEKLRPLEMQMKRRGAGRCGKPGPGAYRMDRPDNIPPFEN